MSMLVKVNVKNLEAQEEEEEEELIDKIEEDYGNKEEQEEEHRQEAEGHSEVEREGQIQPITSLSTDSYNYTASSRAARLSHLQSLKVKVWEASKPSDRNLVGQWMTIFKKREMIFP